MDKRDNTERQNKIKLLSSDFAYTILSINFCTHVCQETFPCRQDAWWEGFFEEGCIEFDFGVVGPVQQRTTEHGKEDGEVEVDVEPPRPGRAGVQCKEIDPAADDQEGILDTVEEKQGAFLGRVIVEMRVVGACER